MIGSDDILACFIAGNAFTWEWVKFTLPKVVVADFSLQ